MIPEVNLTLIYEMNRTNITSSQIDTWTLHIKLCTVCHIPVKLMKKLLAKHLQAWCLVFYCKETESLCSCFCSIFPHADMLQQRHLLDEVP